MSDAETVLYGIPNCDQVKKARAWLDRHGVAYRFHDFKKAGADSVLIATWQQALGWEALLNRKGTTWRGLPEDAKAGVNDAGSAARLMSQYPSLIKRPVLCARNQCWAGFSETLYSSIWKVSS